MKHSLLSIFLPSSVTSYVTHLKTGWIHFCATNVMKMSISSHNPWLCSVACMPHIPHSATGLSVCLSYINGVVNNLQSFQQSIFSLSLWCNFRKTETQHLCPRLCTNAFEHMQRNYKPSNYYHIWCWFLLHVNSSLMHLVQYLSLHFFKTKVILNQFIATENENICETKVFLETLISYKLSLSL